jgi:methylthioribose-1-phosphate isomerase
MGPEPLRTLYWEKGRLFLLDQRLLPGKIRYLECGTAKDVAKTIKEMVVRGAPAIGISAAFGMVLAARELNAAGLGPAEMRERLEKSAETLRNARPTAVNLHWALRRMVRRIEGAAGASTEEVMAALEEEALALLDEDISANRRIGAFGEPLIPDGASILTHCNAGALATAGYGTALGVIRAAAAAGKRLHVYVDETRPLLQGARLTALELHHEKIPATLVTDSCAGYLMAAGKVDLVITGADRIAANGDTANKIGTYTLAVLAQRHGIPFYIAAPCSTVDLSVKDGGGIVIEERDPAEVTMFNGQAIAPAGIDALNPAFDVTPAGLISAIITERGVLQRPGRTGLANLMAKGEG